MAIVYPQMAHCHADFFVPFMLWQSRNMDSATAKRNGRHSLWDEQVQQAGRTSWGVNQLPLVKADGDVHLPAGIKAAMVISQ